MCPCPLPCSVLERLGCLELRSDPLRNFHQRAAAIQQGQLYLARRGPVICCVASPVSCRPAPNVHHAPCHASQGWSNLNVMVEVERGYRLPPPAGCPRAIYKVMMQSWNPHRRYVSWESITLAWVCPRPRLLVAQNSPHASCLNRPPQGPTNLQLVDRTNGIGLRHALSS